MTSPVRDRLLSKLDISGGPDACWPFVGAKKNSKGYGNIWVSGPENSNGRRGSMKSAHRVAYEVFVGPIPEGLHVLHSCDNPPCCNPSHLRLGTNAENMRDKVERGTPVSMSSYARGSRHGSARLTEGTVKEIRTRRQAGERGIDLARAYGVSGATISGVVHGTVWSHVEGGWKRGAST